MNSKAKIVVVDDHEFFRKGVILTINRFKHFEVVGEVSNGKEFLDFINKNQADIVLMDIKMPQLNGIEATKIAMKKFPYLKIIALSMFGDEEYLEQMLGAGIQGFLLKNIDKDGLEHALQMILDGKQYFSEELLPYFTKKYLQKDKPDKKPALTNRETEVLLLIAEGLTNQQIADKLHISLRTVTNHRANLNQKTGSKNTVNLLSYAVKNNLVKL